MTKIVDGNGNLIASTIKSKIVPGLTAKQSADWLLDAYSRLGIEAHIEVQGQATNTEDSEVLEEVEGETVIEGEDLPPIGPTPEDAAAIESLSEVE